MMSIRDYPGFKWRTTPGANGDTYDIWESTFCFDTIFLLEGKFYKVSSMRNFDTIHEAMDYIRDREIVKYFDDIKKYFDEA